MVKEKSSMKIGTEIEAISSIYGALQDLNRDAQMRVLRYVSEMLGIALPQQEAFQGNEKEFSNQSISNTSNAVAPEMGGGSQNDESAEGISSVAARWIARSGLSTKSLQSLFSLGIDEIDLVAKTVPGTNKKERMRNVILLKGIAAYLGTGVSRVTYEQIKEACLHYNAFDTSNFAAYLKSFAAEVSGSKETGLTLTARGINSGTELIKQILG